MASGRHIKEEQCGHDAPQAVPAPSSSANSNRSAWWLTLALAVVAGAAVLAVHWPVLHARAILFDDDRFLFSNETLMNPKIGNAGKVLSEVLESRVQGYYEGLTLVSLMADVAMGGGKKNLYPFHRTSLALHVVNVMLLIVLLWFLFGSPWIAAAAGLLFGLHPLMVEPIAWVWERKTLLSTAFVLGSLICYVCYARRGGKPLFLASLMLFFVALLAKPTVTPLPVLLLLLDYWPLHRIVEKSSKVIRKLALEKVPFLLIASISGIVTVISTARNADVSMPWQIAISSLPLKISYLICFYLGKLLWPSSLSSVYVLPRPIAFSTAIYVLSLLAVVIGLLVLMLLVRRAPGTFVGMCFFLLALAPTLGIVQYSWVVASDKYVYFPALGMVLILCSALTTFIGKPDRRPAIDEKQVESANRGRLVGIILLVLVVAAVEGVVTRRCLARWQTSKRYFTYMISLTPQVEQLHTMLAALLMQEGNTDQAIREYETALRLNPKSAEAHSNLGVYHFERGEMGLAIQHLRLASTASPGDAQIHMNLGLAYLKQDDLVAAGEQFALAVDNQAGWAQAHMNLGHVLFRLNHPAEAVDQYRRALAIEPTRAIAHRRLAEALGTLKNNQEAYAEFVRALKLEPDAETYLSFAEFLENAGRAADASTACQKALESSGDESVRGRARELMARIATRPAG